MHCETFSPIQLVNIYLVCTSDGMALDENDEWISGAELWNVDWIESFLPFGIKNGLFEFQSIQNVVIFVNWRKS